MASSTSRSNWFKDIEGLCTPSGSDIHTQSDASWWVLESVCSPSLASKSISSAAVVATPISCDLVSMVTVSIVTCPWGLYWERPVPVYSRMVKKMDQS